MHAKFSRVARASNASLDLIDYKERRDESLTPFIYRQDELLSQSCNTPAEQCRTRLIIDLLFSRPYNEKIARCIIRKHPNIVARMFKLAQVEEKNTRNRWPFKGNHLPHQ